MANGYVNASSVYMYVQILWLLYMVLYVVHVHEFGNYVGICSVAGGGDGKVAPR